MLRARTLTVSATLPAVLWPLQLTALALTDAVGWPVELWSGVVVLSVGWRCCSGRSRSARNETAQPADLRPASASLRAQLLRGRRPGSAHGQVQVVLVHQVDDAAASTWSVQVAAGR